MWHVWERSEMHTDFSWGHLKEGERLEDLGVDGTIILELILSKENGRA